MATATSTIDQQAVASLAPAVAPLLHENGDANLESFIKQTLDGRNSEVVLAQLSAALQHLSAELGGKVSERLELLLANVHATHTVEAKLLRSNERVDALAQAVRRTHAQCARPQVRLETAVAQLERMQESAQLLRQVQRAVLLCKRLHESLETNLPKAAAALRELAELVGDDSDHALAGVEVLDAELPFIAASGRSVRAQASASLMAGLAGGGAAQAGAALQVFYNLGELRAAARTAATEIAAELSRAVRAAFDVAQFGAEAAQKLAVGGGVLGDLGATSGSRGGMPPPSAATAWRERLWTKAEGVGEALAASALRIAELHRVLERKRDPLTHELFVSAFSVPASASTTPLPGQRAPGKTSAVAVEEPCGHPWAHADADLLSAQAVLGPMVAALLQQSPEVPIPASSPADHQNASMPAEDAASSGEERALAVLWDPLPSALGSSVEAACRGAPFVLATLASELPRFLRLLLRALDRVWVHASPPAEAERAFEAEALLECLAAARDVYQRDLIGGLSATCDAQLQGLDYSFGRRPESSQTLGMAIDVALRKCDGVVPLQRLVAAAGAKAVGIFANRAESLVRWRDDEGTPGAPETSAGYGAAATANADLLAAVRALRASVCASADVQVDDAAATPLRSSLTKLSAVCTVLSNPATPLPESMREDATNMLKVLLRREMIDAQ